MPTRAPSIENEVRALYHGPLGEFTAGRQALSKRLRQAKDPRAAEVLELRKPPLSAWGVNQLFAREAKGMAALIGAGEKARSLQRKVMGGGDAGALRQAIAAARAEIERLAARGVALLSEAERAPGEAIVERLRANLESLAFNPATAPVAARGWLDDDLEPPGFEVLAGLQVAAAGGRPATAGKPKAAAPQPKAAAAPRAAKAPPAKAGKPATVHQFDEGRRAVEARRERVAREEAERQERGRAASERRERIEQAQGELARAESEAGRAERAVAEAERAVEEARERLKRARRAVTEAREALTEAKRS